MKKKSPIIATQFKVHTPKLLEEIAQGSGQYIYRIPLTIMSNLLARVALRATELDDPKLNALMLALTLYSAADPTCEDYDPERVEALILTHLSPPQPATNNQQLTE